jgi:tetratricopeptide (TPR) repeat protein
VALLLQNPTDNRIIFSIPLDFSQLSYIIWKGHHNITYNGRNNVEYSGIDVASAIQKARHLAAKVEIAEPLTRQNIAELTNQLLDLDPASNTAMTYGKVRNLDNNIIISPETKTSKSKTFHYYTKRDLENIIAAKIIEMKYDVSLQHALALVAPVQSEPGRTLPSFSSGVQPVDQSTITGGAARAHRYIWTRSLKYVLEFLFGELHTNTYIIVDLTEDVGEAHPSSTLAISNEKAPDQNYFETTKTRRAAYINSSSMVFISRILSLMETHSAEPAIFTLYDDNKGNLYHIYLYTPRGVDLELTSRGEDLLSTSASYQGHIICTLLDLSFRTFSMPSSLEDLPALAEAVVQILPQFHYCGVLLPEERRFQINELVFRAHSNNFPDHLEASGLISANPMIGWVHRNLLPVFIEEITPNDNRVSIFEKDFSSIAIAPIWSRASWGVLYAASDRQIEESGNILSDTDKEVFSMLAGIAGELAYNEFLFNDNVKNAVRRISAGPISIGDRDRIVDKLTADFTRIHDVDSAEYNGLNLSAIVVAVENLEEIIAHHGPVVGHWIERQLIEKARELIRRSNIDEKYDIFSLQPGRFLILLLRSTAMERDIKNVSINLKKIISQITLKSTSGIQIVECLTWGIVYPYDTYLLHRLGILESRLASATDPNHLAKELFDRIQGASLSLSDNQQGHEALARRDYPAAFNHFFDAWMIDQQSPYFLKHMAEALFWDGKLDKALQYCKDALEIDPLYAGGRYMKAEILTAQGEIDKASEEYKVAIEIIPRSKHFLLYGQSLAISGQYNLAIQQYKKAARSDPQNKNKYDWLIAIALEMKQDPVAARNKLITIPVEEGSGDEMLIQFEIKRIDSLLRRNQILAQ